MAKARPMRLRWDATLLRFGEKHVAGYAIRCDERGVAFVPYFGPLFDTRHEQAPERSHRAAKRAVMQHVLASMAREVERHGKVTARKRARKGRG